MKKRKNILEMNVLYTLLAIVLGFVIGAIFLVTAGLSPAAAYGKLIDGVFGKPKFMIWTLVYASPLIFTGLSVAFSLRTGVFNIGAEGQFVVGSLAACIVGILVDVPAALHVPLCLIAAAAAGFGWSYLVGLLKVKRGIHEVLSYIMFNWIAFYLSNYAVNTTILHKEGNGEATKDVLASARLLFPEGILKALNCTGANWGFILAVIAAVLMWVIIEKTTLGYRLKAVGYNKEAAIFGGINADKSILTALGMSGALAGIGGAVQTLGMSGRISQFAGQEGYGFEGITVALIGGSSPIGCIFSGIFYGAMKYGGSKLTMVGAPEEVIDIIMGCVIIFIAISNVFKELLMKASKRK